MSDHTRFEELVLPHLNATYNLARWLTCDVNDAEDVVQEAWVRALKYVGSLNGSDARPWFLTIVRHAFYDWCKRNRLTEIARIAEIPIGTLMSRLARARGLLQRSPLLRAVN